MWSKKYIGLVPGNFCPPIPFSCLFFVSPFFDSHFPSLQSPFSYFCLFLLFLYCALFFLLSSHSPGQSSFVLLPQAHLLTVLVCLSPICPFPPALFFSSTPPVARGSSFESFSESLIPPLESILSLSLFCLQWPAETMEQWVWGAFSSLLLMVSQAVFYRLLKELTLVKLLSIPQGRDNAAGTYWPVS